MSFEKEYDEKVKRINELREQLKADPHNKTLRDYVDLIKNSKELEKFLKLYNVDTIDDDED
jgi:hypothetical protein